jgi:hypothetical protein
MAFGEKKKAASKAAAGLDVLAERQGFEPWMQVFARILP